MRGARKLHIVSSIGSPNTPATWSGTIHAVCTALEREGAQITTHDISERRSLRRAAALTNTLTGYGLNDPMRVGLGQAQLARRAQQVVDGCGPADFLHFGSPHLPLSTVKPGQRHYLFTDYAVYLLCANPHYRSKTTERFRARAMALEKEMVAQLDGVFTTADYVAAGFTQRYGLPAGKAVAVKSGLGRVLPDPGEKTYDGGYMLFVARRNFLNKGGRLLLDAFDLLKIERPDARLVVIGNTEDRTQSDDLARMRNTPGITFHNFDTPDYAALVAGAALYAGPAPDEPWGIIYLESLSVRTPIVGLDRNAFRQFAGDGAYGFLAADDSPRAVATALLDALSDPARLAAMGAAGREHVLSEYSWDQVAKRILAHMEATVVEPA